jgi:starch phosphorylase
VGATHPKGLIMFKDYYMLLADFDSYVAAQEKISQDYLDRDEWARKSLLNIARSGKFSIDRTVAEYAEDIWNVHSTIDEN